MTPFGLDTSVAVLEGRVRAEKLFRNYTHRCRWAQTSSTSDHAAKEDQSACQPWLAQRAGLLRCCSHKAQGPKQQ